VSLVLLAVLVPRASLDPKGLSGLRDPKGRQDELVPRVPRALLGPSVLQVIQVYKAWLAHRAHLASLESSVYT